MKPVYKETHSFEQRSKEARRMRERYPDRIPVIVESVDSALPELDKKKYLVPNDLTMGQFIYIIRKRIRLSPEKALFMHVNDQMCPTSALMGSIYSEHAEKDYFLYTTVCSESTFG